MNYHRRRCFKVSRVKEAICFVNQRLVNSAFELRLSFDVRSFMPFHKQIILLRRRYFCLQCIIWTNLHTHVPCRLLIRFNKCNLYSVYTYTLCHIFLVIIKHLNCLLLNSTSSTRYEFYRRYMFSTSSIDMLMTMTVNTTW